MSRRPLPRYGGGVGGAELSAASGGCSEAEHPQRSKKSSKRAARRFFRAPQGGGGKYAVATLIFAVNPSVSLAADSLSLRLGHGAALICHWHIIHYRAATSLPLAQGSLWVCRQARRNLFSPITKKKQPFGCFFLVGPAGFGPAGCGSQSPVPYRLATAQSISQGIPEKGIPCAWGG